MEKKCLDAVGSWLFGGGKWKLIGSWCCSPPLGPKPLDIYIYLEPQTTIDKWLFQLDDSQSLHRKWLFHQTSIFKWLFGVPGIYICLFFLEPQIEGFSGVFFIPWGTTRVVFRMRAESLRKKKKDGKDPMESIFGWCGSTVSPWSR